TAMDEGYCVRADDPGMINLTGCFRSTADFGPHNLTSNGGFDIFAAGLNGNGNWYGATRAGGPDSDHAYGIASDSAGNAVIIGDFAETADFGPFSMTSLGLYDAFVMKIDEGNVILARQAGGSGDSEVWGMDVATDPSGNIYATGYFNETAGFGDNSITCAGGYDIFVAKLSTEVDADDPTAPGLTGNSRLHDAYPNPFRAGGTLSIKADIAENESGMIQVFNLRGQKIAQFELPAGRQQVTLDGSGLSAGVYLYRLRTQSTDMVRKLVLMD
ncbi:MAG: T9SS type A sorting domain-containing protein, partial [Candidatus Syntrophosphaera sp.]